MTHIETVHRPSFFTEREAYELLEKSGLKVPEYLAIREPEELSKVSLAEGTPVVVKGIARELWHKSDKGAVHFLDYSPKAVAQLHQKMRDGLEPQYAYCETLVISRVDFQSHRQLPTEAFVSIQKDNCCGGVINFGIGGTLTEAWAAELKQPLLIWPTTVYCPSEALKELKEHWLGRIWLGDLRHGKAMTTEAQLLEFLQGLWRAAELMEEEQLNLLEINPFVLNSDGTPIALDGVGTPTDKIEAEPCPVPVNNQSLLRPQRIAIAGVSKRSNSVGAAMLENLQQSTLPAEQVLVIKEGQSQWGDHPCLPDIGALKTNPVDILIIALPAAITVELIETLCKQGGGAEVVYIVAGGIGDGADSEQYGNRLKTLIAKRRQQGLWTPALVGPNGLGMLQSELHLNSLFIPQSKLNVSFNPSSEVALISQSGAFLITRLSRQNNLSLKYGYSIGNQLDMKLSDFMAMIESDSDVKVIGAYVEGFAEGDSCAIAKLIKQFRANDRHVVIYKGGRSQLGQEAAAGHTGAMAGDYELQKRLLVKSGATVVETFNQFNSVFKWMTAYPDFGKLGQIAIVTNAGYETVGSMDSLGDLECKRLFQLTDSAEQGLSDVLAKHQLTGLVAPTNPLDITPMADEEAYFACVDYFAQLEADTLLIGLVPLSGMLNTAEENQASQFAANLKQLCRDTGKKIGIVIDAGVPYQDYRTIFEQQGFPVFYAMDQAVLGLNILSRSG